MATAKGNSSKATSRHIKALYRSKNRRQSLLKGTTSDSNNESNSEPSIAQSQLFLCAADFFLGWT